MSSRRGYLRPPLPVDTVARIFELRDAGLSFKKIGKALGIAAWTASRYVRSFEEGRPMTREVQHPRCGRQGALQSIQVHAPNVDVATWLAPPQPQAVDGKLARRRGR